MNEIHILMWMIGGGFVLMGIMWRHMNSRMDFLESKLSGDILANSVKMDKLSEKLEDIDRRLCRIEGSLGSQGFWLFSQDKPEKKKAE